MKRIFSMVLSALALALVVSCAQNSPASKGDAAKSQAIKSINYNAEAKSLVLAFERGTYSFAGVPEDVYERLMSSDSQGTFYQTEIRGKYEATRVDK